MADLQRLGALCAAGFLAVSLAPYLPQHEYEARYILIAFGNDVPTGNFVFTAYDAATGEADFVYLVETRDRPAMPLHTLELGVGEWGPSHGYAPRLASGYPAPYLEERAVRVEGGPFAVRLWEGVGVQKDCSALFAGLGLTVHRTTGGTQSWPSHPPPLRASGAPSNPVSYHDSWESTQYLTCAWIEYTGGSGENTPVPGNFQAIQT